MRNLTTDQEDVGSHLAYVPAVLPNNVSRIYSLSDPKGAVIYSQLLWIHPAARLCSGCEKADTAKSCDITDLRSGRLRKNVST